MPAATAGTSIPSGVSRQAAPLVVSFPVDVMARGMAQRLGIELGQQIVIHNPGGAGVAPSAESVARSAPDG